MSIMEIKERTPCWTQRLLEIWEDAVRATHTFLSEGEIREIRQYVPQALSAVPSLLVLENEAGIPAAFMGIDGNKLEMLFVSDKERGKGFGKKLITHGMETYGVNTLTVNAQNPLAKGFYIHMGFRVVKRTEKDEQGNPYPLLYMRRVEKSEDFGAEKKRLQNKKGRGNRRGGQDKINIRQIQNNAAFAMEEMKG